MYNLKRVKKFLIYFLPVTLVQIIFLIIDKHFEMGISTDASKEIRLSMIHLGVYFDFFAIPVYLVLTNVVYNVKKNISKYYHDIRFEYGSILCSNVCILIVNWVCSYLIEYEDINCLLEFFLIFIPQSIVIAILTFLGRFLVIKNDEDCNFNKDDEISILDFYRKEDNRKY